MLRKLVKMWAGRHCTWGGGVYYIEYHRNAIPCATIVMRDGSMVSVTARGGIINVFCGCGKNLPSA